MANSKLTKSLSFALFAIIFSLSIILGAAAQNIYVITYGASEAPQETSQQESIEITTSSDNVLINKYSSDYVFSLGAATQSPEVCICSNMYDKIFITNKAPYDATFTISTSLPEYVTLPYNTIRLSSGSTAEMNLLVKADCEAKENSLEYNILVSNNFGAQYTIERDLQINRCQSISSTLYASQSKIAPCEKVEYTIELKNTAPFTEDYIISPKNTAYFEKGQYEVRLNPEQKAYLNFTYLPDCSVYGKKEIDFSIQSVNNKLSAKLSHELEIERKYDFSVSAEENISICRGKEEVIPIKVKNLAGLDNEFYLTIINKQEFISTETPNAAIKSGEDFTFVIYANPNDNTRTEQVLDYEIKTKLGNLNYRGKINLKVNDCYAVDVNILADKNPELCSGTHTYNVLITNNGLFEERIFLSDDSDYADVFPSTVILDAGESRNVSLALSLPPENKRLQFTVIASTDSQKKTWQDSLSVDVKKMRDCSLLLFEKQKLFARYGTDNVTFKVQNKGSVEESYFLNYDGTSLIQLKTDEVKLKPGESADVVLKILATKEEEQNKFGFKISAISGNDEVYENNMVLKMTDTPWLQKIYNKATSTLCITFTSILIILIILGLIFILILSAKRVRIPLSFKIVSLVLIVVIIIVVLSAKGFPESRYPHISKSAINSTNIIWHEDDTYRLDLNKYFFDPDNDTLMFSVEDMPENISVNIRDSTAQLVPDSNWYGNARIRFVAEDPYGEKATSPRINLNVVDVPEFSWSGCYERNCIYVNALLLILLLALVFLLRTRKESAPMTKKILLSGIRKEKGYLYFVDKDGDVSRAPMARKDKKNQKFKKEKVGKTVAVKRK